MTDTAGPHLILSGYHSGTSPVGQDTYGYYWSSLAYTSATSAYVLFLNGTNSTVYPVSYGTNLFGFSLRCLAQKVNNNIENSIFPTGNTTGEFQSLYNQYPTYDQMRKYPVGMVLGGLYDWGGSAPLNQGALGYYWSSSAYTSATIAYALVLHNIYNSVEPAGYYYKYPGRTLRCLACLNQRNVKKYRNTYRLPTGNTTGEFQSLYTQYPTYDQMRKYPVSGVLGGRYYWDDATLDWQGRIGYYWSGSASSATSAHLPALDGRSNTVNLKNTGVKYSGFTLRCLAQNQTKNKKPSRFNKK